jgi:hypothetical protein
MSITYLDLETAIMSADQISDDIQLLSDRIECDSLSIDEIQIALRGVVVLQKLRHSQLFDVFEQLVKACKLR